MKRVILESPFGSSCQEGVDNNIAYAKACVRDCLKRGETPIASHLLFTQPGTLNDNVTTERVLGINAGLEWYKSAPEACVVYTDRGISRGMQQGIEAASDNKVPIQFRKLGGVWAT